MESCSGISADYSRVAWFRADSILALPGIGAYGVTDWRNHRVALDGRYLSDSAVVRHEMLHELLQRDGHPEEYFGVGGKCFAEISH